jgi:glycosyltransferase involved in cell wall biosynthesis
VVTLHEHYPRHLAKYHAIRKLVSAWIITWSFEQEVRRHLGGQPCFIIHPLYPRQGAVPPGPEAKAGARAALGLPADGLVVGYAGQMDRRKNPAAALHLAEFLEEALGRPLHLLLAGREDRAAAQALDAALAASPLRDRIVRTGPLSDISQAFKALDLYLLTSRNEGFFPIALLEAMERGVPIVAPTVGGISTQLKDGEGGFLIAKPDDRTPLSAALLEAAARRVAKVLADPVAWEAQKRLAIAVSSRLSASYDAAGRFRDAVARWL